MKQNKKHLSQRAGAHLKLAIKNSEWKTQERFSEAFGAAGRTVGRWCNGGLDSFILAEQLADFLNIDVCALLFS